MGITPSTPSHAFTQLYLPADCFRLCTPDSCFCRGGHHSRSKYVYVERNNPSGRESYRDPMELMERGLLPPPGWGMGSMRDWRPKDWDVMNRVLAQWMANQRGITEVPWSEMGLGNQMMGWGGGGLQGGFGGGVPPYPHVPPPWAAWQGGWQNGPPDIGSGGRRGEGAIDEEMREKIRILHDITFGSEADRQEKQMQEQMLKRLQPMIPELAKLIALQQAGLSTGHGLNGNGNGGAMMPGAPPGMGMGGVGMPGMMGGGLPGMNPMMHPLAAMGGMNPMMTGADAGMMGGGVDLGGGPGRRRGRGRRPMRDFDFDDDDEDDFGGFGRGRGGRRRRRGRYNLDDDDLFGDRGGDDSRGREPPPRGPRPRPQPGSGNGNGGGGAVFDTFNDDAHYRTGPLTAHHPAQLTASPLRNSAPQAVPTMATAPPNRILTPVEEPLSTSPPPIHITRPSATDRSYVPPGAIPIPAEGALPYRSFPGTYDMADPSGYPSVPVSDQRPTSRRAHFHPEAGLTRPRQEEENRGEAPAGGPVGAHDITPL